MAIDFPNSPTVGQEFQSGGRIWEWDGTAWRVLSVTSNSIDHGNLGGLADADHPQYLQHTGGTITNYAETCTVETGVTGGKTVSLATSNVFDHTLSGATTYTFSGVPSSPAAASLTLIIRQPATAVAITWPASVKWSAGSAPTFADSEIAICTFITRDGGTEWLGSKVGEFAVPA